MVTKGNWLQWHNWLAGVKFGQEQMRGSLEVLKRVEREIEDYFDQMQGQIRAIQEKYMTQIRELQAISEAVINEGISETTDSALNFSYNPTNPSARQILEIAHTGQCDMLHLRLRVIQVQELEAAIGLKLEGKWLSLPDSPAGRSLFPESSDLSDAQKANLPESVLCGPKADSLMESKVSSEPHRTTGEAIRPIMRIEDDKEEQKGERKLCCQLCLVPKTETDYLLENHRNETCCICDTCFAIKVKPFGKCPLCAEGSLSGRSRSDLRCLRCFQDKQPADFQLFMYLQHPCKLCNSCVLSNMRACLVCLESFSEKDLEVIVAKCGLGEGEHCPCGNLIYKGEFSCPGKCFCSVCHLTNMLLSRNRVCPGCASECIGRMPASLECNRCLRTIFSTGPTKLYVSGICTKGHILCQHCVEVNADQLSCPVCHAVVQGKPASELREAQRKLFLACYCEEVGDVDLAELTCGHILHPRCKYNLHYCRVCGSDLLNHCREKPKEVTIWKYAK